MDRRTEELYELHSTSIYKFTLLMVSHPETAEDLTQDTYIHTYLLIQVMNEDCICFTTTHIVIVQIVI